ncbi:MAG: PEGA domain-containing protein [Deltaproteobacteria bacterium]|nr:PEGA domain-containing protein [Deltaproteobacteria bacterium]
MSFTKYILLIACFFFLRQTVLLFAATSIVIQPVHNGSFDEASDKTAQVLREKLGEKKFLTLINPEKVAAVLAYYKNSQKSGSPQISQVQELLERAKEHYFQFAYADADAELTKAVEIFNADPKLILKEGQTFFDSYITLALVDAAQKKKTEAIGHFKNALHLNPIYQLDAKAFAPSIQKLFQQAKEEVGKEGAGDVEIGSDPKVADIYINGIHQGVAPLKLSALPEGTYNLSFQANNYQSVDQTFSLKAGQKLKLHQRLYWGDAKNSVKKEKKEEKVRRQIEEGLRIAELLKTDKVLMVDVEEDLVAARLVDRRFKASHTPIFISLKNDTENLETQLNKLVELVTAQTELNLLKNPQAYLDPSGVGDPILLGGRRHKKISKGILFGGLGAIAVGGILAGFFLSGGSSAPTTGSLALSFK